MMYRGRKRRMTRNFHWEQCKLEDRCEVWQCSTRPLSFLTPVVTMGVPFSFSNLLEGCTKFTEGYYTHSYYLLHLNDYRLKSEKKKKDRWGRIPENFKHGKFTCLLPGDLQTVLRFLTIICDPMQSIANKESVQYFTVLRDFIGIWFCGHG